MNTTITKDQMILHEGEVHVISNDKTSIGDYGINILASNPEPRVCRFENSFDFKDDFQDIRKVTHSTAKLDGVIHLNREWFVRGEYIDANEEFVKLKGYSEEQFDNEEWSELYWFGAGITTAKNAKKGEFTREQMELAYSYLRGQSELQREELSFDEFINSLQPLSVPEQITLTKEGDLKNIQW